MKLAAEGEFHVLMRLQSGNWCEWIVVEHRGSLCVFPSWRVLFSIRVASV